MRKAEFNRGITYNNKGQHDWAISDYNKAIELDPKYVGAYLSRGIAYSDKGSLDQKIIDLNRAIEA